MRGYLHDPVMLDRLEEGFQEHEANTRREVRVVINDRRGSIDLLANHSGKTIAVEVERSSKRIANALAKGMAIKADELWIVVPNKRAAQAVSRKLVRLSVRPNQVGLYVLTLGQALHRVTNCFPLFSRPSLRE